MSTLRFPFRRFRSARSDRDPHRRQCQMSCRSGRESLFNRCRNNAVFFVKRMLNFAATIRLADCPFHRSRNLVRVQDDATVYIACGTTDDLDERFVERRKPILSALSMAINDTSGRSSPSLNRLMPTSTSNSPVRNFRRMANRSTVAISECRYSTRKPSSLK